MYLTLISNPFQDGNVAKGIFLRFSSQLLSIMANAVCIIMGCLAFPSIARFNRELFRVLWRGVSHCSLSVFLGTAVALIILASGFLLSAQVSPRVTLNPPDPSHQNSTCTKYRWDFMIIHPVFLKIFFQLIGYYSFMQVMEFSQSSTRD